MIRFGTYNIHNGRNGEIDSALQVMSKANIDLEVFQKTKVTDRFHTHASVGYLIFATYVPVQHSIGVTVFYMDKLPQFQVEAMQQHDTNVLCFQVDSGGRRWFIVGCYLAPNGADTIKCIVAAIGQRPRGAALLGTGGFNTDLATT